MSCHESTPPAPACARSCTRCPRQRGIRLALVAGEPGQSGGPRCRDGCDSRVGREPAAERPVRAVLRGVPETPAARGDLHRRQPLQRQPAELPRARVPRAGARDQPALPRRRAPVRAGAAVGRGPDLVRDLRAGPHACARVGALSGLLAAGGPAWRAHDADAGARLGRRTRSRSSRSRTTRTGSDASTDSSCGWTRPSRTCARAWRRAWCSRAP